MKRLIGVLVLAGCGGTHEETIDGDWISQVNDACAVLASFDTKAGTYVHSLACTLAGGGGGIDIESGTADFAAGRISLTPKSASCPTANHSPEVDAYTVAPGSLTIADPTGGISFIRLPKAGSPTSVQAQFGCWSMGQFTASPVAPL